MIDLSVRSRARVWAGTVVGTLFCVCAAILFDLPNFSGMTTAELRRAVTVDIWLPTALAGPLLFLLLRKIRALSIAHDEMAVMAATDNLTGILNRGAFTMLVEAYLERTQKTASSECGSLLIVDADRFKAINDSYGHAFGDEALRHIAKGIQSVLRPDDLVGRIGGEEFGVFLPATNSGQALNVAERIRAGIASIPFPGANQNLLSVSIGGVSFHREHSYDRLFKVADQCLYIAKDGGRNRVNMINYIGDIAA